MKVIDVKPDKDWGVYDVTLAPNFIERLFGVKEKTISLKDSGDEYTFGGGTVYIDKDGNKLSNHNYIGEAIDKFIRKW